jgi:hypothetical protein
MSITLIAEGTIAQLIDEAKDIPSGLCVPPKSMIRRNGHWQKSYEFDCPSGNRFVVKIRQSCVNPLNFSVILGYVLPGSYTVFRLRRYNGKSHHHTNVLENESFYDFHVHTATERYQRPGFNEDHFAETTSRFYDLGSAVQCLLSECGFRDPLADAPLFRKL